MSVKKKSIYREFGITSLAVDNAISVLLLTAMVVVFGRIAYVSMPKEQYPEVVIPTILINTPYPGNSAKDIENLVTRPIEKELKTISGIDDITSTSMQDFSSIIAEFSTDITVEQAFREIKDAVDKAKQELPNDLPAEPDIKDINLADFPIVSINLSGNFSVDELREYAEYLQDEVEELPEISEGEIKGALEREVKIDLDLPAMQSSRITFYQVEQAIQEENITLSGGEITTNDFKRAIRVVGEFKNIESIRNIIVKSENQNPIYLRDIAEVTFGYEDRTSYARSDGYPVVSVDVIKRSGYNLLEAASKIETIVDNARAEIFPENLKVTLFNDQSVYTRTQVADLENSIISGVILVVLVLLFFLGFRNSLFVGIAIPLSMLTGILFLSLTSVTMNVVVLFSLILALGLLVDNAIVVVENIYRYRQEGYTGKDASKSGTGEVALPIIASTATTLAAFLPLAFWPGIMGSFMKYMPITLIIVLTSSLFVALVINPVLTSLLMKVENPDAEASKAKSNRNVIIALSVMIGIGIFGHIAGVMWLRNAMLILTLGTFVVYFLFGPASRYFQAVLLPILERAYDGFIRVVLHGPMPLITFIGTFGLLFLAFFLFSVSSPKVEYFPAPDPAYINVFVEMPIGTDISVTNELVKEVEEQVNEVVKPISHIVDAVLTQIGEGTSDPNAPPEPGLTPHKARITVSFLPSTERGDISTYDVMEDIRKAVKGYPGVVIAVDKNADGPATGKPINLELTGEDINVLSELSGEVIDYLNQQNVPGIEELKPDVKLGKPELIVEIDREAARRYGMATRTIASTLRTALYGSEASKYKLGEDEYPIQVRLHPKYRNDVNSLLSQKILFRSESTGDLMEIPISAVADVEYTSTYTSVKRKNLDKVITVYSNVLQGYNANEIISDLTTAMEDYELPTGYRWEFTGEQQEQAKDMEFLNRAFSIAIFTIFFILVAQFNSIVAPFIIILSVFFSLIGVLFGYVITGMDFIVIMTGVGIISLAGVVVNNAIVLIDYINLTRNRKRKELGLVEGQELPDEHIKESIVIGGKIRLRPVLLTAITTILGLIPLAIGFNFNFQTFITELNPRIFIGGDNVAFWGTMAWTVIYGLAFATFLTLVVVPVMYWLFFKATRWVMGIFGIAPPVWDPTEANDPREQEAAGV
ncbi:MAG: efflux RND transporter permease subunit [Bacteroidota bacterium]